jgi:integrase
MASIRYKRLSDGTKAYQVRFRTTDGKERSKQFKRKREADAYVNLVEVDRASGALIDPRLGRTTIDEWWTQWWPTVTNLRASTRARDAQFYRTHIRPVFGDTPLAKLDRTTVRTWVAKLGSGVGSNLAPATIHKVVQVLNKCVDSAVQDRLIQHNPVAKLPLPKIEHSEMRFLTSDEVWELADEIDARYRAFVLVGGFCGLRLGELLGLRWSRVDLSGRRLQVTETLVDIEGAIHFGPPKTNASVRSVPVPSFVCEELSSMVEDDAKPGDLVFRSPEGHPVRPSLLRARFWQPAVRRADLQPLRIHDLRHTAVSLWIANGAHPKQVATLAGHTSVSVVLDRYGHLYPQHDLDLRSAMESHTNRQVRGPLDG